MRDILDCIDSRITQDNNAILTKKISSEEVKGAIFSMHPDKCSGPDGLNPAIYQQFWEIISRNVVQECTRILET